MAYNPNYQNRGDSGGRRQSYNNNWQDNQNSGYNNSGGRKRGREDENQDSSYRRRNNERGDYSSPRNDRDGPAGVMGAQRFKTLLWTLGSTEDYDPLVTITDYVQKIRVQFVSAKPSVFEAFRVAITELPCKLPHYVAIISQLSTAVIVPPQPASIPSESPKPIVAINKIPGLPDKPVAAEEHSVQGDSLGEKIEADVLMEEAVAVSVNVGQEIILDIMKALQVYLDERKWRNVRYCVHFFAHLAALPVPLVSTASFLALLSSFSAVLDEPGLLASRGDENVRIIVEGLLRLGSAATGVESLLTTVQSYMTTRKIELSLFGDAESSGQFEDHLVNLVATVTTEIPQNLNVLPDIVSKLPAVEPTSISPLELNSVVVPPELTDLEAVIASKILPSSSGLRGDEGVGYEGVRLYLKLFDDDTVPSSSDPAGEIVRSLIHDMIHLYEVNRKDCARILLELGNWVVGGTFKPRVAMMADEEDALVRRDWSMVNMIVESILSSLFSLPGPQLSIVYYQSLLMELCRLEPALVAPALGKTLRKLYSGLGAGASSGYPILDPAGIKTFAEWFSVHLSNFGFSWSWSDWAPDMENGVDHPKKVFIKRVIELEVRLSYHDRVKGTIPDSLLDAGVMSEEAPGPEYAYEDSEHRHADSAASLLRLVRSKGTIAEVETEMASFKSSLMADQGLDEDEAESVKLDMAVQTILTVGSRSFSHFLNALERYLTLLRTLASTASGRVKLLHTVANYWRRNSQFHLIVIDKLLQYRLVDPADVITWIFSTNSQGVKQSWSDMNTYDLLKTTVGIVQSKVEGCRGRLAGVRREEEAKAAVAELDNLTYEPREVSEVEAIVESRQQLESVETELAATISEIVRNFVLLLPEDSDKDDWETWWTEGWFREFARSMASALALPVVKDAIKKLELPKDSPVSLILESANAWRQFV